MLSLSDLLQTVPFCTHFSSKDATQLMEVTLHLDGKRYNQPVPTALPTSC